MIPKKEAILYFFNLCLNLPAAGRLEFEFMIVEVCANSLESAINAEKAGADRIELCAELAVGGLTPSYGLLKAVIDRISIPVRVLIRPRSGDFTYSEIEFEVMVKDIELCRELGFEGIVVGFLTPDFILDKDRFEDLLQRTNQLKVTFHRAFDWVADPFKTLEWLDGLGVDTLLSSGQQTTALEGMDLLAQLKRKASKTVIMPGSGINIHNAQHFKEKGFEAIHLSGTRRHRKLNETPKVTMNSPHLLSDDSIAISDFEIIQEIVKKVK